jgi:hypothetical protein
MIYIYCMATNSLLRLYRFKQNTTGRHNITSTKRVSPPAIGAATTHVTQLSLLSSIILTLTPQSVINKEHPINQENMYKIATHPALSVPP